MPSRLWRSSVATIRLATGGDERCGSTTSTVLAVGTYERMCEKLAECWPYAPDEFAMHLNGCRGRMSKQPKGRGRPKKAIGLRSPAENEHL